MTKKIIIPLIAVFLLPIILLVFKIKGHNNLNPWGLWNKYDIGDGELKIIKLRDGKYYRISTGGLYILKNGNVLFKDLDYPLFFISGDATKIEKYEAISDGYIFSLVGQGFNGTDEGPQFQDDTRLQVKMHFISKDVCYFEYVSREDANGFHLSYFPEEEIIYKRFKVK